MKVTIVVNSPLHSELSVDFQFNERFSLCSGAGLFMNINNARILVMQLQAAIDRLEELRLKANDPNK